jgi:hypothetical protein
VHGGCRCDRTLAAGGTSVAFTGTPRAGSTRTSGAAWGAVAAAVAAASLSVGTTAVATATVAALAVVIAVAASLVGARSQDDRDVGRPARRALDLNTAFRLLG